MTTRKPKPTETHEAHPLKKLWKVFVDKLFEKIAVTVIAAMVAFVAAKADLMLNEIKHQKGVMSTQTFEDSVGVKMDIYNQLRDYLQVTFKGHDSAADVMLFHNGTESVFGVSFLKYSSFINVSRYDGPKQEDEDGISVFVPFKHISGEPISDLFPLFSSLTRHRCSVVSAVSNKDAMIINQQLSLKSSVVCPVFMDGALSGVTVVGTRMDHQFSDADIEEIFNISKTIVDHSLNIVKKPN